MHILYNRGNTQEIACGFTPEAAKECYGNSREAMGLQVPGLASWIVVNRSSLQPSF